MPEKPSAGQISLEQKFLLAIDKLKGRIAELERKEAPAVAVIGLAHRFPGSGEDREAFFRMLLHQADCISEVPRTRWDLDQYFDPDPDTPGKMATRYGGFMTNVNVADFDAAFFGIAPKEAISMDPQHRLLLECCHESIENAGIDARRLVGSRTGVFVGISAFDYSALLSRLGEEAIDPYRGTGNAASVAAGRISYAFGFQGPSFALDTACSSSLYALHHARESLARGECDAAIVAGVNLLLSPELTIYFSRGRFMAPDGRCKTFDASANGYVRGEGCGVVLLERAEDAVKRGRRIRALIRASAVNQDGRSGGLTVPNGPAQESVIQEALFHARLKPSDVDYVEAHGTGTQLGDPIEANALAAVYGQGRGVARPLMLGSVKTNVGHLEAAAGMVSLIKVIAALEHEIMPPQRPLQHPNTKVNWGRHPLSVLTHPMPWPRGTVPRRAGISAFAFQGSNAHVIVEEAPLPKQGGALSRPTEAREQLIVLSAKTATALRASAGRLAEWFRGASHLEDAAYTLAVGRAGYRHRAAIVAASTKVAAQQLARFFSEGASVDLSAGEVSASAPITLGLVLTGHGWGQGNERTLYAAEPTFAAAVDRCMDLLAGEARAPLLSMLRGGAPVGPAAMDLCSFVVTHALTTLLLSWGIRPSLLAATGPALYAAGVAAGALPLQQALEDVAAGRDPSEAFDVEASAETSEMTLVVPRGPGDGQPSSMQQVAVEALRGQGAEHVLVVGALADTATTSDTTIFPAAEPTRGKLLDVIGRLFVLGAEPDWSAMYAGRGLRPVELPTYAFERQRYWLSGGDVTSPSPTDHFVLDWHPLSKKDAKPIEGRILVVGDATIAGNMPSATRVALGDPLRQFLAARPASEVDRIIFSVGDEASRDADVVTHTQSLLSALLAVWRWIEHAPATLSLVTRGAFSIRPGERASLSARALWGLGRVMGLEDRERFGAMIDLDPEAPVDMASVHIATELASVDGEESVSWRGGERFGLRMIRSSTPSARFHARADVTYLVTGGLGALGLTLAHWLAENGAMHLVLTSRNAENDPSRAEAQRDALRMLRARGVSVDVVVANDAASLTAVFERARAAGVPIHTAFHLAGSQSFASARAVDEEALSSTLAAKVRGALVLDEVGRAQGLELLVLYASGAGVWGGARQGAYAAANAVLDALASRREALGFPTLSMDWGPWSGDGLSGDPGIVAQLDKLGTRPLVRARAMSTLGALLASGARGAHIIADFDWPRFVSVYEARGPRSLLRALDRPRDASSDRAASAPAHATSRWAEQHATESEQQQRDALRALTVEIIAGATGHTGFPANTPFMELGVDSLMAVDIRNRLTHSVALDLPATLLFDQPHLEALLDYLHQRLFAGERTRSGHRVQRNGGDARIAIVGMGCRLPGGADHPEKFWQLMLASIDAIREVPDGRWRAPGGLAADGPNILGGFMPDLAEFDARLFGLSDAEADAMDPQQRLVLDSAWQALESAGIPLDRLVGTRTGVFLGISSADYASIASDTSSAYAVTGASLNAAAGRVSYLLGLEGPALAIDTACSSSLSALHLACASLSSGETDLTIAGGVNALISQAAFAALSHAGALGRDGRCKSFSAMADGYGRGEGCAMFALKRLSDAQRDGDRVLAVIVGTAVNHDGRSSGFTAPNGPAQQRVIREALQVAAVDPQGVDYVEAHGTGTKLGDPIEVQALSAVLGAGRDSAQPLLVGTAKTQVGHLESAAGAVGLLKVVLSLIHEQLPRNLHAERPNPLIAWERLPVSIITRSVPWCKTSRRRRRAGVSSFGITGTNAHLVVEEAPELDGVPPLPDEQHEQLIILHAHTPHALHGLAEALARRMTSATSLADVSAAALHGRARGPYAIAVIAREARAAKHHLERADVRQVQLSSTRVALVLPGLPGPSGSEERWCAADVAYERAYRAVIAPAAPGMLPPEARSRAFASHYATATALQTRGVSPDVLLAEGSGIIAALASLGALEVSEAIAGLRDGVIPEAALTHARAGDVWVEHEGRLQPFRDLSGAQRIAHARRNDGCFPVSALAGAGFGVAVVNANDLPASSDPSLRVVGLSPASDAPRRALLTALAEVHISGGRIRWEGLVPRERHGRFEIPACPRERRRHWLDSGDSGLQVAAWRPDPDLKGAFAMTVDTLSSPELSDHVIYDRIVVPGAFYLSKLLLLLRQEPHLGDGLCDVGFDEPLLLDEGGPARVRLVIAEADERGRPFEMLGRERGAEEWIRLGSGRFSTQIDEREDASVTAEERFPAAAYTGEVFYANLRRIQLNLGHAFRWIAHLESDGVVVSGTLRARDADDHVVPGQLPPGFLDSCFQAVGAAFTPDSAEHAVIFLGVGAVVQRGEWTGESLSFRAERRGKDLGTVRISSADERFELQLRRVRIHQAPRQALFRRKNERARPWSYLVEWTPQALETTPSTPGPVRVVAPSAAYDRAQKLSMSLSDRGSDASAIALDAGVQLADLDVVYYLPRPSSAATAETIESSLEEVLSPLLSFLQAQHARPPKRLRFISEGAVSVSGDEVCQPIVAAAWGLVRGFAHEMPELSMQLIDIDDASTDALVAELLGHSLEDEVCLRRGTRLVARLARIPSKDPQAPRAVLSEGSVIVSGGLGAIGRIVVAWLVQQGAKEIVLMGRHAPNEETTRYIEGLARPEVIVCAQADVAVREDVARVVAGAKTRQGRIAAVFHCAGVLHDGVIEKQTWSSLREVLRAKAVGAVLFGELAGDDTPVVHFSSVAGVLGNAGQSGYAAANAYLDAYASSERARGRPHTSIAWGPWGEAGMAARAPASAVLGFFQPLSADDGTRLLETHWQEPRGLVLILNADLAAWSRAGSGGRRTPSKLRALLGLTGAQAPQSSGELASLVARLPPEEWRQAIDERLAVEVRRILGPNAQGLAADQPFSEAGVDSLMAIELRGRVGALVGKSLPATIVYDYPSLNALSGYVRQLLSPRVEVTSGPQTIAPAESRGVAIVGMSCRFPGGANSPKQYEDLLFAGRSGISVVPRERWSAERFYDPDPHAPGKMVTKWGGFLQGIDVAEFDHSFFGITPREARAMDPQHRILLETIVEALEDACIAPRSLVGTKTGVFLGIMMSDYAELLSSLGQDTIDPYRGTGTSFSAAAGRVSYLFGLQGPCFALDTACSSSLYALHHARESLLRGECDKAIVAGVNLLLSPSGTIFLSKGGFMSPDGQSRAFDAAANGYVRGEGCGVVILERVDDAVRSRHRTRAIVRGSAVNQDGRSAGLTVPNGPAQEVVIRDALSSAHVAPNEVDYVEAHGTGTQLGDPIEMNALAAVFGDGRPRTHPLIVGSVKTNLGHLEAAAGMASLIKLVLALERESIPKQLHFVQPNRKIDWEHLPVCVAAETLEWKRSPRRRIAGLSAFAFQGSNAHVIVEEAPVVLPEPPTSDAEPQLLVLSAKSPSALRRRAEALVDRLRTTPRLALSSVARALALGRDHHAQRMAVVCHNLDEARMRLEAFLREAHSPGHSSDEAKVAILFPGTGVGPEALQRLCAAAPTLSARVDAARRRLSALFGCDVESLSARPPPEQPASLPAAISVAFESLLAEEWRRAGVRAERVVAFGAGRWAAAVFAGALTLDDAFACVLEPARLSSVSISTPRLAVLTSAARPLMTPEEIQTGLEMLEPPVRESMAAMWPTLGGLGINCLLTVGAASEGRVSSEGIRSIVPAWVRLSPRECFLEALAALYVQGVDVAWSAVVDGAGQVVGVPTYPFERQRHWLDEPSDSGARAWSAATRFVAEPFPDVEMRRAESIERASVGYIVRALQEIAGPGRALDLDQIQHRSTVERWLAHLLKRGLAERDREGRWALTAAAGEARVEVIGATPRESAPAEEILLAACGDALAAVVRGERDPRELLFPGGSSALMTQMYTESYGTRYFNAIQREIVARVVDTCGGDRALHVLEVGGGTGSTTAALLPVLPPDRTRYVFSDVSAFFLRGAQARFAQFPFVEYSVFDLDRDPRPQGLEPGSFDVIVAVNVLHACRDLSAVLERTASLLRHEGILLATEVTTPSAFFDITFGLVVQEVAREGQRVDGRVFLDLEGWRQALSRAGFEPIQRYPHDDMLGTHVLAARRVAAGRRAFSTSARELSSAQAGRRGGTTALPPRTPAAPRRTSAEDAVRHLIAEISNQDPAQVQLDDRLSTIGLDSLMFVELRARLRATAEAPITVAPGIDYSVRELAEAMREAWAREVAGPTQAPASGVTLDARRRGEAFRSSAIDTPIGRVVLHAYPGRTGVDPALLVHGLNANGMCFDANGWRDALPRRLSRQGIPAYVLDLWGCGRSTIVAGASPDALPGALRAVVDEVLRDCQARRLHWIGHSFGFRLVLMAWPELHDRLATLTSIAGAVPGLLSDEALSPTTQSARGAQDEDWVQRVLDGGDGLLFERANFDQAWLREYLQSALEPPGRHAAAEYYKQAAAAAEQRARDALRAIDTPFLYLVGARDPFAGPASVRLVRESCVAADLDYRVVGTASGDSRDYGHIDLLACLDATSDVFLRIEKFLSRMLAGRTVARTELG